MNMLRKSLDARNTFEGKALAVFLSVVLALSFVNVTALASEPDPEPAGTADVPASTDSAPDPAANGAADASSAQAGEATGQVQPAAPAEDPGPSADQPAADPLDPADPQAGLLPDDGSADSADPAAGDPAGNGLDGAQPEPDAGDAPAAGEAPQAAQASPAFQGYAQAGGVLVKVTAAENVVPEGTAVQAFQVQSQQVVNAVANAVESQGKQLEDAVAIDVALLDAQGNAVQPNGMVNVCFFNAGLSGGEIGVYHVADDASSAVPVGARQASSSVQSFDVSHFSIYVVTAQGSPVLVTYNFYNGSDVVDTQIVKSDQNESVTAPATPKAPAGKRFEGWFIDGNASAPFVPGTVTGYAQATTVSVQAVFSDVHYVFFHAVGDGNVVYKTLEATAGSGYKVAPPADYEPAGARVTGWYTGTPDSQTAFTADTVVTADTDVYPNTVDCYWVSFNTLGGTGVPSQYVDRGTQLDLSGIAAPTRHGYTFAGWSTAQGGTVPVASVTPEADMTLYAIWQGAPVDYTVVYWGENADDQEYSALATATRQANADADVTLDAQSGALPNSVPDRRYFTFERSDTVTVAADGSSVVNVYFQRNEYTITFDILGYYLGWDWNDAGQGTYSRQPVMTIGGRAYSDTYSFTAKYEQDISALWPTASNVTTEPQRITGNNRPTTTTYSFLGWDQTHVSKRLTLTADLIADGSFAAYWRTDLIYYELHYLFETPDGTGAPYTYQGTTRYYAQSEEYSQFAYANGSWNAKDISGFTAVNVVQDNWSGSDGDVDVYLYYSRNSYTLTLNNYGSLANESVMFGASIADKGAEPARPAAFSENAEFKGWYTVAPGQITADTHPFGFEGATMPASDLVLYAYWVEQPVTVEISVEVDAGNPRTFGMTVPVGTAISGTPEYAEALQYIADSGKTLLKWVDGQGNLVDVNQPLYRDASIRAVFAGDVYTVTYQPGEGTGGTVVDGYRYYPDTAAKAAVFPDTFTAPDGQTFSHWADAAGNAYYPGQDIPVTASNVALTANYVPVHAKVTLTYHANFAGASPSEHVEDRLLNNQEVVLAAYAATGLPDRANYVFAGWDTSADGTGTRYQAGQAVHVDNLAPANNLYAQWEQATTSITVGKVWNGSIDGLANPAIEIKLLGNDNAVLGTYTLPNTETSCTFEDVPVADGSGKAHEFTVAESTAGGSTLVRDGGTLSVPVPGIQGTIDYSVAVAGNAEQGFTITNTTSTALLTVGKTVADSTTAHEESLAQAFPVSVAGAGLSESFSLKNGESKVIAVQKGAEYTVSETANQTTWKSTYSVNGGTAAGGTSVKVVVQGNTAVNFTNTRVPFHYYVHKQWYTDNASQLPNELVVRVYQIDKATTVFDHPDKELVYTGTLSNWGDGTDDSGVSVHEATLDCGLFPYASLTGAKYHYIGNEDVPANFTEINNGWTGWSSEGGIGPDGIRTSTGALNNYYNTASLTGTKTWIDFEADKTHDNASEIVLTLERRSLLTDWESYDYAADGNVSLRWDGDAYTFTGLPKYDEAPFGWEYRVIEAPVGGYYTTQDGNDLTNQQIQGIKVVADSNSWTYDGNAHSQDSYKLYIGGAAEPVPVGAEGTYTFANGDKLTVDVAGAVTNVAEGEVANVATVTGIVNAGGEDVSGAYEVEVGNGTLAVAPKPVTVEAADKTYTFNAAVQGPQGATFTGTEIAGNAAVDGLVGSDAMEAVTIAGGQMDAGTYAGELVPSSAVIRNGGTDASGNYVITYVAGDLVIMPAGTMTVQASDVTQTYDGTPYGITDAHASVSGATVRFWNEATQAYDLDASPTFTDATTGAQVVRFRATHPYYEPAEGQATVTVVPRPVTFTSGSATKVFDGRPLVNGEVAVGGMGFAAGEGAAFDVTGSQTEVGSSANTFTYELAPGTAAGNYVIAMVEGTLTVADASEPPEPPVPPTPPTPPTPPDPPVQPTTPPVLTAPELPEGPGNTSTDTVSETAAPLAEAIGEDTTPLAGRDHAWCWVHYYIILGIVLTAAYSLGVVARRLNYGRKIQRFEDDTLGKDGQAADGAAPAGAAAPRGARPTMAEGTEA